MKKTEPHNPESHAHRHRLPIICFAALALICFGAAGQALISGVQRQSIRDRSLAVLPFVNLADTNGHDYFSMGLTEDVLTSVAGARRLRVVGRNSSKVYRQTQKSLREIADELDVTYLLQGSVRREQDRVRISVQLVNAQTDEIPVGRKLRP